MQKTLWFVLVASFYTTYPANLLFSERSIFLTAALCRRSKPSILRRQSESLSSAQPHPARHGKHQHSTLTRAAVWSNLCVTNTSCSPSYPSIRFDRAEKSPPNNPNVNKLRQAA